MSARLRNGLLLGLAAAKLVAADGDEPGMPVLPGTSPQCVLWYDHSGFLTCNQVLEFSFISLEDFRQWNPSIGDGCTNMQAGYSYCIEIDPNLPIDGNPATSTTTTTSITSPTTLTTITTTKTTSTATPTDPGNGITTPTPTQPGMVDNCDAFHFVEEGSTCSDILSTYGITLAQLYEWNPSVGSDCAGLWAEVYVCVSTVDHTPTPSQPGNGITTPTPTQGEIVSDCDSFYLVQEGETCDVVAKKNGISVSELQLWNPSIGDDCTGLWANAYACVSVIGHTPTPVDPGNGIETPTPTQGEIVSDCDSFYLVQEGETCDVVAKKNGISVSELQLWNPSIGDDCTGLWANAYACVSIIGHTPTPVDPGNGIETPTPIQDGMTKNCKAFHFVDGETCQNILDRYKISLADFVKWNPAVGNNCQSMWDQTYVCVAVL